MLTLRSIIIGSHTQYILRSVQQPIPKYKAIDSDVLYSDYLLNFPRFHQHQQPHTYLPLLQPLLSLWTFRGLGPCLRLILNKCLCNAWMNWPWVKVSLLSKTMSTCLSQTTYKERRGGYFDLRCPEGSVCGHMTSLIWAWRTTGCYDRSKQQRQLLHLMVTSEQVKKKIGREWNPPSPFKKHPNGLNS